MDMCEVEDLPVQLRQRRLRWFGQVKRAESNLLTVLEGERG